MRMKKRRRMHDGLLLNDLHKNDNLSTQALGSDSGTAAINVHPMDCSVNLSVHQVGEDGDRGDNLKDADADISGGCDTLFAASVSSWPDNTHCASSSKKTVTFLLKMRMKRMMVTTM